MAPLSDWLLPGRFGPETWRDDGARFAPVSANGEQPERPLDPLLLDRIGARNTRCAHPGPLPTAFRFCPRCGEPLAVAPAADRSAPWSPSFGDRNGLPERDGIPAPDPDTMEEIALPTGAITLAVAGAPARLLCCDRTSGVVFAFSPRDRDWHRLARVPACAALPRWSWSALATATELVLPTERGPVRIDLCRVADAPVLAPAEPCVSLGGPAQVGAAAVAPVLRDGVLAIAVLSAERWEIRPVAGAAAAEPFAAPVGGMDTAFWCAPGGQLAVRDTGEAIEARFTPWADGVQPLIDARPVAGRDGTLHMPARLDAATLVFETLFAPGQPRGRRVARGYAPSTGHAVFRENALLRLPWDERPICDYPLEDDGFFYPLLSLGEKRFVLAVCNDRARLGAFLGDPIAPTPFDAPPLSCTLVYTPGPRRLEPLDCVLRAHRASDLAATLHGDALLVHGAIENRCFRWALRDAF